MPKHQCTAYVKLSAQLSVHIRNMVVSHNCNLSPWAVMENVFFTTPK